MGQILSGISTEVIASLQRRLGTSRKVAVDGTSAENHSISDLIKLDAHLANQANVSSDVPTLGYRQQTFVSRSTG